MQQTVQNPYEQCPVYETPAFTIRLVREDDARDLLACYSDPRSAPFFNSDNCTGDFVFGSLPEMQQCIHFWLLEYENAGFIRFSIVDRARRAAVGTIECFARPGTFAGLGRVGMLRIDLASPYENEPVLSEILDGISAGFYDIFGVQSMITKAVPAAGERIAALRKHGYAPQPGSLVLALPHYWVQSR